MSDSKSKRREYDYRDKYLNHNKGILGKYYICGLCFRVVNTEDMEVDHIVPLSKLGPNHIVNCMATCRECNRKKSDKLGWITFRGVIWKIFEEIVIWSFYFAKYLISILAKILVYPFSVTNNLTSKLCILIVYAIFIYYLLQS